MNDVSTLQIAEDLIVPLTELTFRVSRSGGPGGQHVNTSSTRVGLVWSLLNSKSLTDDQRERLLDKLANRINQAGELFLTESGSRSQHRNREVILERFQQLIAGALIVPKPRRRTEPPRASKEKRLEQKKKRSEVKKLRGGRGIEE